MSARDDALSLIGRMLPPEHAQAYVELFARRFDAYAHELAEQQRDYVRTLAKDRFRFGSAHWAVVGADVAADLIDPEVASNG